jgi:hypothetical protein
MSIQIAITGRAKVQIQGRMHREAPWADIGQKREQSCLIYVDPIRSLRAVSSETAADSSVSVWAAWISRLRLHYGRMQKVHVVDRAAMKAAADESKVDSAGSICCPTTPASVR